MVTILIIMILKEDTNLSTAANLIFGKFGAKKDCFFLRWLFLFLLILGDIDWSASKKWRKENLKTEI